MTEIKRNVNRSKDFDYEKMVPNSAYLHSSPLVDNAELTTKSNTNFNSNKKSGDQSSEDAKSGIRDFRAVWNESGKIATS